MLMTNILITAFKKCNVKVIVYWVVAVKPPSKHVMGVFSILL
jgi:hypothetical protein